MGLETVAQTRKTSKRGWKSQRLVLAGSLALYSTKTDVDVPTAIIRPDEMRLVELRPPCTILLTVTVEIYWAGRRSQDAAEDSPSPEEEEGAGNVCEWKFKTAAEADTWLSSLRLMLSSRADDDQPSSSLTTMLAFASVVAISPAHAHSLLPVFATMESGRASKKSSLKGTGRGSKLVQSHKEREKTAPERAQRAGGEVEVEQRLLISLFSTLDVREVGRMLDCCIRWRQLIMANQHIIWKHIAFARWASLPPTTQPRSWFVFVRRRIIGTHWAHRCMTVRRAIHDEYHSATTMPNVPVECCAIALHQAPDIPETDPSDLDGTRSEDGNTKVKRQSPVQKVSRRLTEALTGRKDKDAGEVLDVEELIPPGPRVRCPVSLSQLQRTEEVGLDYCSICKKIVHLMDSQEQVVQHVARGRQEPVVVDVTGEIRVARDRAEMLYRRMLAQQGV